MCMRSTLGCGFLASLSFVLQPSLLLKHRRSARGAWVRLGDQEGQQVCCWGWCRVMADIWHVYSCHLPVTFAWLVNNSLFVLVSAHMPRMCLWHASSDVCWLFHCFFDSLKELNVNFTYDQHILLRINHMSDIIWYNNFSTVTSEQIVFLLCKFQYSNANDKWNGYMHWSQWKQSFCQHTTYAMDTCIENRAFADAARLDSPPERKRLAGASGVLL